MALPQDGAVYTAEDGTVSTVLPDDFDPDYEPTVKELHDYAKWIGIDLDSEGHLMWIAREGLKAPIPEEWKMCRTDTGDTYYFNFTTGDSIWDHPLDDEYKDKVMAERQRPGSQPRKQFGRKQQKDNGKKSSKSGGSSSTEQRKLEKGAGGNSTAAESKPIAQVNTTTTASDFKPKMGRLASLNGSDGGSTMNRPDISDLIPTSSSIASGEPKLRNPSILGGGNNNKFGVLGSQQQQGSLDAMKAAQNMQQEEEQRFRQRLQTEHEELFQGIVVQHQKQIALKEEELDHERRRVERQLEDELDETVRATRRRVEQRTTHELRSFEESIGRERDDARRRLQELQQQLQNTVESTRRRVDAELTTKRRHQDNAVREAAQQRLRDVEHGWMREKQNTDLQTEAQIRDVQAEFHKKLETIRHDLQVESQRRVMNAENDINEQLAKAKITIRTTKEKRLEALQREIEEASQHQSEAVRHAEEEMQRALMLARAEKTRREAEERRKGEEALERLKHEMTAKRQEVELRSAQQLSGSQQEKATQLRERARIRLADQEVVLENERKLRESKYREETEQLVDAAKRAKSANAEAASHEESHERDAHAEAEAAIRRTIREGLNKQMEQVRDEHDHALNEMRRELELEEAKESAAITGESARLLEADKAAWLRDHPPPSAPPVTTDADKAVREAIESEKHRLDTIHKEKLAQLKAQIAEERATMINAHRKKALREMDERLAQYKRDRQSRALVTHEESSPGDNQDEPQQQEVIVESTPPPLSPAAVTQLESHRKVMKQRLDAIHQTILSDRDAKVRAAVAQVATTGSSSSSAPLTALPTVASLLAKYPPLPDLPPIPDPLPPYRPPQLPATSSTQPPQQHATRGGLLPPSNAILYPAPTAASGLLSISNSPAHPPPHTTTSRGASSEMIPSSHSAAEQHGLPPMSANVSPQPVAHYHHLGSHGTPLNSGMGQSTAPTMAPAPQSQGTPSSSLTDKQRRIQAAHDHIKKKKHEIRIRQSELEEAREEWRRDMARAKKSGNVKQQEILYVAKGVLEERARVLNEDTIGVKKSIDWLNKHEAKYLGEATTAMNPSKSSQPQPTATTHAHFDPSSLSGSLPEPSDNKAMMLALHHIATKVATMEASVKKMMTSSRDNSPDAGHGRSRRKHHHQAESPPVMTTNAETGGTTVERWLQETTQ